MFLTVNPSKTYTNYAVYKLTDQAGKIVHIGVSKICDIFKFQDAPKIFKNEEHYFSILSVDENKIKMVNLAVNLALKNDLPELKNSLIREFQNVRKGVICNETGEKFISAAECARKHNLTYSALTKHLSGEKSYQTVKKRTYKRIAI